MANLHRGEIDATLGGRRVTLCLTLGALAELEAKFAAEDLSALGERLSEGRVSARHLIAILGAGLRGAGHAMTDEEVAAAPMDDGLKGAAEIAARLLRATFGAAE